MGVGMAAASIKEVAQHAGVSLGTVSNVLNRPEMVAEATRQRVLDAIAELGYVRNDSARQLRAGRSRTVAIVVLDVSNPFFTDVVRGAEAVVAYVGGPFSIRQVADRHAGAAGALSGRGADELQVVRTPHLSVSAGRDAADE